MGPGQNVFEGGQFYKPVSLGSQIGNVPINLALSGAFEITAGGSITILNPTGAPTACDTMFSVAITQDSTGSRAVSFGSAYLIPPGAQFSTAPGATDLVICQLLSSGNVKVVGVTSNTFDQASVKYNTNTATSGATLTAANISGAFDVTLNLTGTLGGDANAQLPTVAALATALGGSVAGASYKLRVINSSSANHVWTITTNTGWTLNGTMTLAQNTFRDFYVTFTSATAASLQQIGTGTTS